ncbi:MAG: phosphocholine cytidylyltransferase family protein [Dehalococcoidia bacterium]
MQAVIIAAGDGGRLYPLTSDTPKPLLKLRGRPIINHVLDALRTAGVNDVVVVLGYRGEQIRRALDDLSPCGMRIRFVENEEFMLGNARSLWSARTVVDGSFVLAMADHLVEPDLARALIDNADGRCRLAVEHTHGADTRAGEATLAHVREGLVIDLGKGIAEWNALDTGMFWCTPGIFDTMTPDLRDGEAGAVFATLARSGGLDAVDVSGYRWIDIDTPEDLRRADEMLAGGGLWREHARGA